MPAKAKAKRKKNAPKAVPAQAAGGGGGGPPKARTAANSGIDQLSVQLELLTHAAAVARDDKEAKLLLSRHSADAVARGFERARATAAAIAKAAAAGGTPALLRAGSATCECQRMEWTPLRFARTNGAVWMTAIAAAGEQQQQRAAPAADAAAKPPAGTGNVKKTNSAGPPTCTDCVAATSLLRVRAALLNEDASNVAGNRNAYHGSALCWHGDDFGEHTCACRPHAHRLDGTGTERGGGYSTPLQYAYDTPVASSFQYNAAIGGGRCERDADVLHALYQQLQRECDVRDANAAADRRAFDKKSRYGGALVPPRPPPPPATAGVTDVNAADAADDALGDVHDPVCDGAAMTWLVDLCVSNGLNLSALHHWEFAPLRGWRRPDAARGSAEHPRMARSSMHYPLTNVNTGIGQHEHTRLTMSGARLLDPTAHGVPVVPVVHPPHTRTLLRYVLTDRLTTRSALDPYVLYRGAFDFMPRATRLSLALLDAHARAGVSIDVDTVYDHREHTHVVRALADANATRQQFVTDSAYARAALDNGVRDVNVPDDPFEAARKAAAELGGQPPMALAVCHALSDAHWRVRVKCIALSDAKWLNAHVLPPDVMYHDVVSTNDGHTPPPVSDPYAYALDQPRMQRTARRFPPPPEPYPDAGWYDCVLRSVLQSYGWTHVRGGNFARYQCLRALCARVRDDGDTTTGFDLQCLAVPLRPPPAPIKGVTYVPPAPVSVWSLLDSGEWFRGDPHFVWRAKQLLQHTIARVNGVRAVRVVDTALQDALVGAYPALGHVAALVCVVQQYHWLMPTPPGVTL